MDIDGDLAELLGIHVGDGCISKNERYSEYYLGGDLTEEREYHDSWVGPLFNKKIMLPLLNRKIVYKEHPKVGVYGFYLFNHTVVQFFEKLGIKAGSKLHVTIPQVILDQPPLHKRFLRGLFDTDGTLYFDKNRSAKQPVNKVPMIRLGSVSKLLIQQVHEMLQGLGIHSRIMKPWKGKRNKNALHAVTISRKKDIHYFIENIEFKNTKHVTRWKVYKKLGYCPPRTTIRQRKRILRQ